MLTHEDIDQPGGNLPVAWNKQRKLLLPAQGHRDAQIWQGNAPNGDALFGLIAEPVLDLRTDRAVPVGEVVVRNVKDSFALAHEDGLPGTVVQQQQVLFVYHDGAVGKIHGHLDTDTVQRELTVCG